VTYSIEKKNERSLKHTIRKNIQNKIYWSLLPSEQNHQKTVWRSVFFFNSALEIQCHIVKNTPTDCVWAILLTVKRSFGLYKHYTIILNNIQDHFPIQVDPHSLGE